MTKFNKYEPQPRDFFRSTDPNTVPPLVSFIKGSTYAEPCAGATDLVKMLKPYATCNWASDIEPQHCDVIQKDALSLTEEDVRGCDYFITNSPFSWPMLQPLLDHLPTIKPTWLLLPADFMHNRQSKPYMKRCEYIVSVGRLFFHKGGESLDVKYKRGTANHCWYKFVDYECDTVFKGRV